ncbi:class I SAM-dependent methyltransferase [Nocardia jejuensis]|uniref:class I SAM-dependent methyltransferase n=1 Tax=Nocardia jejuensis TaxID=328049 RepID=UPI000835E9EE|nr:class I SAM-dependent methyltransferase [Nocardia jejuensis]
MVTLPPGEPGTPSLEPHRVTRVAVSFGSHAARYDRTRPAYPAALVERIVAAAGPGILDVGCGTGTASRQFQAAGCRVLGVEPDARMADFARRGGLTVEESTFETWDPADRTFDAVIAATAWHWVDPLAGAAKAARVLRPGGLLAPFWHVFQLPQEISAAFTTAYTRVAPDSPFRLQPAGSTLEMYQALFDKAADSICAAGAFDTPAQWRYDWEHTYTRAEWLDQIPTHGPLNDLPPGDLAEVLDAVGEAIDNLGGAFRLPYSTIAVTARRNSSPAPA